jgi:hypothetical protein
LQEKSEKVITEQHPELVAEQSTGYHRHR